jgi:autotransporter translocation and assembly factor TamB
MKRFLKIVIALTLFILVLLLVALAALQTDWVQTRIKIKIEHVANEYLNGTLTIGTLSGSILWDLTLKEVTLKDTSGTLFSASQISVGYELPALLQNALLITHVEMVKPEIHLTRDQEQTWNVSRIVRSPGPESKSSKTEKQEPLILIQAMQIRDGMIRIQGQPGALDVEIQMRAALNGQTVFLKELKASTSKSNANLNGRLSLISGDEQFDLACKSFSVWLPEISPFAQVNFPDRLVKGDFSIKGNTKKANLTYQLSPDEDQSLQGKAQVDLKDPLRLDLECNMKALQLQPWVPSVPATINGVIRVVVVPDQLNKINGHANINLTSSSFFGEKLERAQVSLSVKPGLHTVLEAEMTGPSGDLKLSGSGYISGLFSSQTSLEGDVHLISRRVNLSSLDAGIRTVEELTGDLRFRKETGQPLEETRISTNVAAGPSRWRDVRVEKFSIAGDYWNGRFSIHKAEFNLPGAFLKVIGTGDINESVAAEINLNFKDLLPLSTELLHQQLHGAATLNLQLSGKTVRPRVQGKINGSNISGFGASVDSFGFQISGDTSTLASQVSFSCLRIRHKNAEVTALNVTGAVSPERSTFKIRSQIDSTDLFELSGSITDLNRPSKYLSINPIRLTLKNTVWRNVNPVMAVLNPESIRIKSFDFARNEQRISITGALATKASSDVSLVLKNLRIQEILKMADFNVRPEGLLNSQLHLTGTAASPRITVDSRITNGKWKSYELSLLTLHSQYEGQSVSVKMMMQSSAGDTLRVNGSIPVNLSLEGREVRIPDHGLDLSVEGGGINLGLLSQFVPFLDEVQAHADIKAMLKGNPLNPEVDGTLAVNGEKISVRGFPQPIRHFQTEVTFGNREIQLRRLRCSLGSEGKVEMHGSLGLNGLQLDTKGLNLYVEGNSIDLGFLTRVIPALAEVQAHANIKGSLKGNPFDPEVMGTFEIAGDKVLVQYLSEPVSDLHMQAIFDKQQIQIKRLVCSLGKKGRMDVNGTAHLKRLWLSDILVHAQVRSAPIKVDKKAKGIITADFTAEGALDSLKIKGNATVTEGTFYADQIAETSNDIIIKETRIIGDQGTASTGEFVQSILAGLMLEAKLHLPGNVWVKGLGINVELKGDLTASKVNEKPIIINGELNTVRGFYEFKQKTFRIERGKIQFIGLPEPDPLLDIQAAYNVDEVAIYLVVGGSLSKMTLSFNSNPSMDETDIMAYLMFGKPVNKLGRSESNQYQQMALSFFGSGVTGKLKQVLGEKFSLDVIALERTGTGFGAGTLSLGKYVTPRIFMTYKHVTGLESKNQVEAEYEINERFSIESTVGDNTSTGADFFWRYEY